MTGLNEMSNHSTRPIRFRDYLPEVLRGDETDPGNFENRFLKPFEDLFEELQSILEGVSSEDLRLTVDSIPLGPIATIEVQALQSSGERFLKGSVIIRHGESPSAAILAQDLPADLEGPASVEVEHTVFALALKSGDRLEVVSEGKSLLLTFLAVKKIEIRLRSPRDEPPRFPAHTFASRAGHSDYTALATDYPTVSDVNRLFVQDADFASSVKAGDEIVLHAGGLPDLFNPDLTPPPQLARRLHLDEYRGESDSAFLSFLASWIGLPLRSDLIRRAGETDLGQPSVNDTRYDRRRARWNRNLVRTAVGIYARRGTRAGVEGMLRAWLKDDLVENGVMVTDLLRAHTDVDAVFQLGVRATLGVDTVLGEGPPFFFVADLTVDSTVRGLRSPAGIDVFIREARFILEAETPAHTYFQLRVHANPMQLAPPAGHEVTGEIYAQLGETTLLWGDPSIFPLDDRSQRRHDSHKHG
jgi:hypothetical protein